MAVPALNKEEVDELYELFDKYDDDGNGELELEELAKMMNNLGTSLITYLYDKIPYIQSTSISR